MGFCFTDLTDETSAIIAHDVHAWHFNLLVHGCLNAPFLNNSGSPRSRGSTFPLSYHRLSVPHAMAFKLPSHSDVVGRRTLVAVALKVICQFLIRSAQSNAACMLSHLFAIATLTFPLVLLDLSYHTLNRVISPMPWRMHGPVQVTLGTFTTLVGWSATWTSWKRLVGSPGFNATK